MKNKDDLENKKFELIPIGKILAEQNNTYVYIYEEYRPALKHLKFFSHMLIFIKDEHDKIHSNIVYDDKEFTYKEEFSITESKLKQNQCGVKLITSKILRLKEEKGIIEIDSLNINNNTLIFDIKPYFPCEDRVENVHTPDFIDELPQWRKESDNISKIEEIEYSSEIFSNIMIKENLKHEEIKENHSFEAIGVIRKIDGEVYLKINNISVLDELKAFSHIRVLWWFDKFDKSSYRKVTECNPPYENAPRTGIFATRSPVRPNPIALTTVKILDVDINRGLIKISHIDSFDKTPIVDIVPYIPAIDRVKKCDVPEWLKHWPEWLDDRDNSYGFGNIEIVESDISKIKKFMRFKERGKRGDKNILEEAPKVELGAREEIVIIGARQNNLKNISLKIPKNKMTVITGVSGSGKSSLAFDTVYAESQRRFMDSISTSGRTLFEQIEKPEFDQIIGLPPAIAIEQKTTGRNPRSTVGTMTDIYDYLKLLFAKIGTRHCPECGRAIVSLKEDEIVNILSKLEPNTFFSIKAFNDKENVNSSRKNMLGEFIVPEDIVSNYDFNKQLKEAVIKALFIGNGAIIVTINKKEQYVFQTKETCYHCNRIFFELTTSTFSFNNPESMCPVCKGLGVKFEVDPESIVSNPELSILDGASSWWGNLRKHRKNLNANWMKGEILALAEDMGIDLELPWSKLPEDFKNQALYGSNGRKVKLVYENTNGRRGEIVRPVEGAYNSITRLFKESDGESKNRVTSSFIRESKCNSCGGERLSPEGRLVTIAGTRFPETVIMTIEELKTWISNLPQKLSEEEVKISLQVIKDIRKRLQNLIDVGVSYLTLDRAVPTLSGGEAQRIRLATQLGSEITNILYVLDEPSIGLHPKDHKKLIKIIQKLKDEGNTVLIVEHDADTMLAADKIIDIGPGAGVYGGFIISEGTPEEIMKNPHSETGKYLNSTSNLIVKNNNKSCGWIKIKGAKYNNLKNIDVEIPLGLFTCVTGVSGSGKSSLVFKTLYPALAGHLNKSDDICEEFDSIEGIEELDKIICISQQPIGRTPKSNPATYTGVFDEIRNFFASLQESKDKGYKQNKFSFNSKEGQCEACSGEGRKRIEMHFMPDVWVECSVCHGKRFNKESLEVKYKGKTISDVLDMNVEEALKLFMDNNKIGKILQTLKDVGLGYIKLGQSALTLSGGEAQRIKLAKELSREETGNTIYLLDEPTTGLHFSDVQNLLNIIQRITEAGNTVLVIEHNLDVIKNADWIIDLGPDGGNTGGYVVAKGTPMEVSKVVKSYTGQCLSKFLI